MNNMSAFKHNKKRNTGLVYEFLVRRMASQMLEQDLDGYQKSFEIARKYYSEGQPLAQERELFEVLKNTRGVSENLARKILSEVREHAKKLDRRLIEIKKSNLIKDVNYTFGKNFFSEHRVPEYRLLASIHMYLETSGQTLAESVSRVQLEEGLVKFMTTKEPAAAPQRDEKEVDGLVVGLAAQKFQERYGKTLNKDQKALLEKYMMATISGGDVTKLQEFIQSERSRLTLILNRAKTLKEIREDAVMKERLEEASQHLKSTISNLSLDAKVEDVMLYYKLVEELASDE